MAKENLFMKKAHEMDLLDNEEIAFMSDVTCSNGNAGRVWFFLNNNLLFLHEPKGLADFGDRVETLDLNKAKFVKGSGFVLHTHMTLAVDGLIYRFQGFAQGKRIVSLFQERCKG
jgi:hypothetical protein